MTPSNGGSRRGFAAMPVEKRRAIAKKGGESRSSKKGGSSEQHRKAGRQSHKNS